MTTTPFTADRLAEIEALTTEMGRWRDGDFEQQCVSCREGVHTPGELEPTPLCNLCAQRLVDDVPELLAEVRRLQTSVLRLTESARAACESWMSACKERDANGARVSDLENGLRAVWYRFR